MTDETWDPNSKKRSDIADRDTPLIRNQWYVAALSEEITRTPMRRTILEQDILLYRNQEGKPIGLQNRCAHRSFPLHLGALNGDNIVCGYHGFEYNTEGRCVHVPALGKPRPTIRIQPYPVVEIGPFVWIWAGDPEAIDHGKLMKQPWFTESGWRYVSGYIPIEANYLGMHENLFDLSHFPFLHTFAKAHVELAGELTKVEVLPNRVVSRRTMRNYPTQPAIQRLMEFQHPITEDALSMCETPAMHYAEVKVTDSSDPPRRMARYIAHCMTPETAAKTHYYWAISRDCGLDSQEIDDEIKLRSNQTFQEDRRALEEIERIAARDRRPSFREMIVTSDSGGIQVLRLFARMAEAEAARTSRLSPE